MAPGRIRVALNPQGLDANVALPLTTGGGINARARVAGGDAPLTARPLNGRVRVQLADLGFIAQLSPEIDSIKGNIDGNLGLGGTIDQPNVLGRLAVNLPRTVLVTPGLVVENVTLAALGQGNSIAIKGHAESGGGPLDINGGIALNKGGQDVNLAITGQRFQVAHIPDATAYISPGSESRGDPDAGRRQRQRDHSRGLDHAAQSAGIGRADGSSDQVIVQSDDQQSAPAAAAGRAVHANVKVILGDKVHVEAFGLKANLARQPARDPGAGQRTRPAPARSISSTARTRPTARTWISRPARSCSLVAGERAGYRYQGRAPSQRRHHRGRDRPRAGDPAQDRAVF